MTEGTAMTPWNRPNKEDKIYSPVGKLAEQAKQVKSNLSWGHISTAQPSLQLAVVLSPLAVANTLAQRYVTTNCHMSPRLKKPFPVGAVGPSNERCQFFMRLGVIHASLDPYVSKPLSITGGPI